MSKSGALIIAVITTSALLTANAYSMTCAPYYGQDYKEDFNSLATVGTSSALPIGWGFIEIGTGADTTYAASDGSLPAANTYSFGNNADRALGELVDTTSSHRSTIGGCFVNRTGATIKSFDFGYRLEVWRTQPCNLNPQQRLVQFSTDATALDNGTWVGVPALSAQSNLGSPYGVAIDGNAYPNNQNVGPVTVSPQGGWLPGATLFVRWTHPTFGFCEGSAFGYDDVTLTTRVCSLDMDGNGQLDALTDGLILLRALFGLTGNSVTNGALSANANRPDWTAIRGYLNASCGTNFAP